MKKAECLLMIIVIAAMVSMSLPAPTYAQPTGVSIYAWTDKASYDPGERGTLTIVIRNDGTQDYILYNITIEYPWFSYNGKKWEGNDTIKTPGDSLMKNGGVRTYTSTFTVPTDGRIASASATSGDYIQIRAYVDKPPYLFTSYPRIYVRGAPIPMTIQGTMITLLIIQAVLMIVCTIIIAAIIFFSTRRSRAIWAEEGKEKSE